MLPSSHEKALKHFSQLVNTRVEPLIRHGMVKKVNRKGGESHRFFVATRAALYICRHHAFIRPLKISHVYSWVDLIEFKMMSPTTFTFTFRKQSVTLMHSSPGSFLPPILGFLRSLLPPGIALINAPAGMQLLSSPPKETQFVDLFVSFCHSLQITPDEVLINDLKRTLVNKQPLEILQVLYNKHMLQAMCNALVFARTVQDLTIGGFNFQNLYKNIEKILTNNNTLEKLRIVSYSKNLNFSDFANCLARSSVKELTFVSVTFQKAMIQTLADSIIMCNNLKHIGFVNCNFDLAIFAPLFEYPENLKNIDSFEISKDENGMSLYYTPKIISLLMVSGIKNLNLTEVAVDVALVFSSIEKTPDLEIKALNLSGNYCSQSYKGCASLPISLEYLKLAEVRWDGNTLNNFLLMQQFKSEISLDLSGASFHGSILSDPFDYLNSSSFNSLVSKLEWNNNVITPSLLNFFKKSTVLKIVSFERCSIPLDARNDVINSLNEFINETSLVQLSIKGSFRMFNYELMDKIKDSLINHLTLEEFDISDNVIGDKGIEILGDVINNAKNITHIKCDGEAPKQPDLYINFLTSIVKSGTYTKISKPRNDIENLITKSKSHEKILNKTWNYVYNVMEERQTKLLSLNKTSEATSEEQISADTDSIQFPNNILNHQPDDDKNNLSFHEHYSEGIDNVSWDMTIEVGFNGLKEEWDELAKQFSIENIIGLNHMISDDEINQTDLIDFS